MHIESLLPAEPPLSAHDNDVSVSLNDTSTTNTGHGNDVSASLDDTMPLVPPPMLPFSPDSTEESNNGPTLSSTPVVISKSSSQLHVPHHHLFHIAKPPAQLLPRSPSPFLLCSTPN